MTTPDQPRPVWLYHGDVSWLYTTEDTPQRREALARLTDGFNRAPADPTRAVVSALIWSPSVNPERVTVLAPLVLRALGAPDA